MNAKINSIPYFLFLNNPVEIENIEKLQNANIYLIIAIKYLPLLILLLAFGSIPNTIGELYLFSIGSTLAIIFGFIFHKFLNWLKESILVFSIIAFLLVYFQLVDPIHFDSALFYCMQSLIILYLIFDAFVVKSYQNYYLTESQSLKVKSERKKRPLFTFGKREFLHVKQGFNFDFDVKLNGFYIYFNENEVQNETNH
ncbi:MAG: hypothetical protein WCY75_06985 [Sulfurimonadaceae bacterium]